MHSKYTTAPLINMMLVRVFASLVPRVITAQRTSRELPPTTGQAPDEILTTSAVRWFEPGQTGVTFKSLFGDLLRGASEITVVDPHVKSFRQIRLFGEFLESVIPAGSAEVTIRLITSTATAGPGWALGQAEKLLALQEHFGAKGLKLSVNFDETIHDRWISTDEFTLMIGRGLDIWEASTCYSRPQHERPIAQKFAVVTVAAMEFDYSHEKGLVS